MQWGGLAIMVAVILFLAYRVFDGALERDDLAAQVKHEKMTIDVLRIVSVYLAGCGNDCNISSMNQYVNDNLAELKIPITSREQGDHLYIDAVTIRFSGKAVASVEVSN